METMQKSLDEIVAKLSAVTTEVKSTSAEVMGFRKQMEDYGTDLDGIKRRILEPERAGLPPRLDILPRGKGVLTNNGAPLLGAAPPGQAPFHTAPSSPVEQDTGACFQQPQGQTAPRAHQEHDDVRIRAPRHDFPRFSGELPMLWIDQSLNYFEMFKVARHQWVSMAMLYFEGHAALWYQAYKRRHELVTWDMLTAAVVEEFGQGEYDGQMNKLMQLRQTGTVAEYKKEFEECMYHLLALDDTLSTRWFVSKFIFGLRDDIRVAVRLQEPASITRAASLARIQEEELDHHRPRARPVAPTKHPPTNAVQTTPAPRTEWPRKQGNDDFNRERQLRDFRRANNLCFKCGDKFSKEHQCKRSSQLLTIEVGEFGEVLSDEAVLAMELLQETTVPAACCHMSLAVVAGTEAPNSMRIQAMVGDQVMILLVDSGSSHTFVTTTFAARAGCKISSAPTVSVRVANGQTLPCDQQVLGLQWCYKGHVFEDDMRLLDVGAYDAILGMDWLDRCSPMFCHWAHKTLRFAHQNEVVTLQGMVVVEQPQLPELSVKQLHELLETNDVWA
jgi:hypothetical protein